MRTLFLGSRAWSLPLPRFNLHVNSTVSKCIYASSPGTARELRTGAGPERIQTTPSQQTRAEHGFRGDQRARLRSSRQFTRKLAVNSGGHAAALLPGGATHIRVDR